MSGKPVPRSRADYRHQRLITTRWMDNDVYGHVNNVVYYSWFDTVVNQYLVEQGVLDQVVVNQYLVEQGVLDFREGRVVGLVVETHCSYFSSVSFPDRVTACLRVGRLGTSSVQYEIGLFANDADTASAQGHFVHVYVDRASNRPTPLPAALRAALEPLVVSA